MPDISGFTHFVNNTEITHSQHIIAELLELLIDNDELGLVVSEIEGDAVLFYKFESSPTAADIIAQAEKTFLAFHNHLRQYDINRICDCGACRTAPNLTLKMVAHQGDIGIIKVKEFQKPYGADVILVHRLMKNDVPIDEYLLLAGGVLDNVEEGSLTSRFPWAKFELATSTYPELGEVEYVYIPLTPLYEKVKTFERPPDFDRAENPIKNEIFIERPIEEVFELVSNLGKRVQWNKGLKDIQFDEYKVNRAGTEHLCTLPNGKLNFVTLGAHQEKDHRLYVEQIKKIPIAKEVIGLFELTSQDGGTLVSNEIHIKPLKFVGKLIDKILRKQFNKGSMSGLEELKRVAEEGRTNILESV